MDGMEVLNNLRGTISDIGALKPVVNALPVPQAVKDLVDKAEDVDDFFDKLPGAAPKKKKFNFSDLFEDIGTTVGPGLGMVSSIGMMNSPENTFSGKSIYDVMNQVGTNRAIDPQSGPLHNPAVEKPTTPYGRTKWKSAQNTNKIITSQQKLKIQDIVSNPDFDFGKVDERLSAINRSPNRAAELASFLGELQSKLVPLNNYLDKYKLR